MELVGFADDATGAMDVAGALHSRGYSLRVNMEGCTRGATDIVTVDNPMLSDEKLIAALRDATMDEYTPRAFLKIDSTLRGNLSSSHNALQEFTGDKPLFIAPALPFYGRTCVDGIYFVKGRPIHATEFAGDRKFQHDTSVLNDHFPGADHIGWRTLDGGVDAVIEAVEQSTERSFTFDTRDQTDLEVVAETSLIADASIIGSSGIARAFPQTEALPSATYVIPSLPALFVIGSIHSSSRAQKQLLTSTDGVAIEVTLPNSSEAVQSNRAVQETAMRHLLAGKSVFLSTPDERIIDLGLQIRLERILGECASVTDVPHNLVIVGGETVRATLRARNIGSLLLRGEYEDGIPIATQTMTSTGAIITKAGGFGHPGTLTNIHNFIRKN
jgi:uncharacterized protein YgbK (DUF1537 family)